MRVELDEDDGNTTKSTTGTSAPPRNLQKRVVGLGLVGSSQESAKSDASNRFVPQFVNKNERENGEAAAKG